MKKFLLLLFLIACSEKQNTNSLSPSDFESKLKSMPNAILVDVRTKDEIKEGALAGAQNIVYDKTFDQKLDSLPKEAPIFVYCAKGKRSAHAAEILQKNGYKTVYQLKGGIDAWKKADLPLVK